ncbi:LysR substrate-binding domain-containing protein [Streptomyces albogriseolus]|uniref:LysR substrate-binding domain-containing protein n=1 Tax=Streptomyces albogriseolus TaxID=1887 RepID=UPI0037A44E7B
MPQRHGRHRDADAGIVPEAVRDLLEREGPVRWSLIPGLTAELHRRVTAGDLALAVVTDAPPGLPHDPRVERRFLGDDAMVVVLPAGHRLAGRGPVRIRELAGETWAEDNDGSAALLRGHAARAGAEVRVDLAAADLPGKLALIAMGHAVALVPGALTRARSGTGLRGVRAARLIRAPDGGPGLTRPHVGPPTPAGPWPTYSSRSPGHAEAPTG